ncbi:tRNA-splicing endonuclease subunit Sen34 isoform X2 [Hypanus sabinus]|uniref:tRNA-splicing endonuclease subunit Sen34 isoform X2 n=1 Tax=Hypanus sabinus TaxID=79690 RepID=UPI0028C45492|nr:tRNA-splicing endonuclease subunit Sen34 isoform X2 [Hypanus sabinus]
MQHMNGSRRHQSRQLSPATSCCRRETGSVGWRMGKTLFYFLGTVSQIDSSPIDQQAPQDHVSAGGADTDSAIVHQRKSRCDWLEWAVPPTGGLKMPLNWQALENVPLLLYILAAKTLLLCLAFAGAKHYQSKRLEAKLQRQREEAQRLKAEDKKAQ